MVTSGSGQERVARIVLRSLTGSIVLTRYEQDETGTASTEVDLSFCKAGAYFLEITGRNGTIRVFRLIKV